MMPDLKLWLRRRFLAWLRQKLRSVSQPLPRFRRGETLLVFAPHQDDETLGCGGLIIQAVDAGAIVHVVFITDGCHSHPGHPEVSPAQLTEMRAREARAAADILGVPSQNLLFLGAPDGRLPHLGARERTHLVEHMRGLIKSLNPDCVFVCSALDGSSEHEAACELVGRASAGRPTRVFEYLVWSQWSPRLLLRVLRASHEVYRCELSEESAALKRAAINAYRSQVEPSPPWSHPVLSHAFLSVFDATEEFFIIRPCPQHCRD